MPQGPLGKKILERRTAVPNHSDLEGDIKLIPRGPMLFCQALFPGT